MPGRRPNPFLLLLGGITMSGRNVPRLVLGIVLLLVGIYLFVIGMR